MSASDHNSVLVAASRRLDLSERYCVATDALELDRALRRHQQSLELAIVFTDFDLQPDDAKRIAPALPYVVVDDRPAGTVVVSPGVGALLNDLSFFDRVVVSDEERWNSFRSLYGLSASVRETWRDPSDNAAFDQILANGLARLAFDRERELESDESVPLSGTCLRDLKLTHRIEAAMVTGALSALPGSHRPRVLQFGLGEGRWCHTLSPTVDYVALERDQRLLEGASRRLEDAGAQAFASLDDLPFSAPFDVVLSVDGLSDASRRVSVAELVDATAVRGPSSGGGRLLLLDDFGAHMCVRDLEEVLWDASDGQLLLERCEIARFPHRPLRRTRALLQLCWIGD